MKTFHLLFLGNPQNPNLPGDIYGYLPKVEGLRLTSFQSRTDKALSISRAPVRTVCTEFNDVEETLALVRAVHAIDPFDGVMAIYEFFTPLAARIRDELGICGVSRHSVRASLDKLVARDVLARAGLSKVAFAKIDSRADLERFCRETPGRVVLKPINGGASRCVFFIHDRAEIPEIWAKAQAGLDDPEWLTVSREGQLVGYMAERFIDGAEYSVECITHDRETHVIAVVEKGLKGSIEAGHAVPPTSLSPERATAMGDFVKQVLGAIEVDSGISHTEVKWSEFGPEIVEINLRMGGDNISKVVQLAYGSDIILDYFRLMAHGERPRRAHQEAAGIRFFLPEHCRIESVQNIESAKAIPGVQSVVIDAAPGRVIGDIKSSRDRAGYVIARAKTTQGVRESLDRAVETVKFVVSQAESPLT